MTHIAATRRRIAFFVTTIAAVALAMVMLLAPASGSGPAAPGDATPQPMATTQYFAQR